MSGYEPAVVHRSQLTILFRVNEFTNHGLTVRVVEKDLTFAERASQELCVTSIYYANRLMHHEANEQGCSDRAFSNDIYDLFYPCVFFLKVCYL
jgi:hypothetical protein